MMTEKKSNFRNLTAQLLFIVYMGLNIFEILNLNKTALTHFWFDTNALFRPVTHFINLSFGVFSVLSLHYLWLQDAPQ
jgi:hypothetical protein